MRAGFILSGVTAGIRRNLSMTAALVLTTAIATLFLAGAILANTEIGNFRKTYEDKINVSIYLCSKNPVGRCTAQTDEPQKRAIAAKLRIDPKVASYSYLSEQQVYERYKKTISPEIIKTGVYKPGVLPATFIVHLHNLSKDFNAFRLGYATLPGVGTVSDQSAAFKTLLDIIDGVQTGALVLAVLVLVGAMLLIANTVQVAAAQRKEETSIMRLVGASRWMTELPFILETLIATLLGTVLGFAMVGVVQNYLLGNVFGTQTGRGVIPALGRSDILFAGGVCVVVGLVLSALTAFATLRLRVKL
jgi:cell division transport system permease protein